MKRMTLTIAVTSSLIGIMLCFTLTDLSLNEERHSISLPQQTPLAADTRPAQPQPSGSPDNAMPPESVMNTARAKVNQKAVNEVPSSAPLETLLQELKDDYLLQIPNASLASTEELREQLYELAVSEPIELDELLVRYEFEPPGEMRTWLGALLVETRDPRVEEYAMGLVLDGNESLRAEGFELLDRLDIAIPMARGLAFDALQTEQNPKVLAQAIAALNLSVATWKEAEPLLDVLEELVTHEDSLVRRNTIVAFSEWGKDKLTVDAVWAALSDPAKEVREATAFAIAEDKLSSSGLKAKLSQVVADNNEDWIVREHASRAVCNYHLEEDAEHDICIRFRGKAEALLEDAERKR